jgi:hypothetical protein
VKKGTAPTFSKISAKHGGSGSSPTKADSTASGESRTLPFHFRWQCERARLLLHCCRTIQHARACGRSAEATIRQIARQRRGKTYKCDPRRKLPLSVQTLRRVFYRWKKSGCSPAALELQYKSGRREISGTQRAIVRQHLLDSRTVSLVAVHRTMRTAGQWTRSYDTLLRSLPRAWRTHLRTVFRARQRHHRAERSFARALNQKGCA